ncbi:liprin-alpha-2 [Nephila pilipes]|uniref:Liprin-alpha-2 n=1 Tax=Nephila pilipes TaxID=299642 RepID=A0A8X6MVA3_NEPPI|nr:liprin-alpha-2 [Nephila pilipes]
MWNMMCDVMPTIAEDSLGQRGGQFAADEANFEQLMVNILDERDKLLETLRDTQENLANTHIKINDLSKERDSLQRQLQANLPQVKMSNLICILMLHLAYILLLCFL